MASEAEEPEEPLVTIAPYAPPPPEPLDRPWVGPMFVIGVPVALAVVVFIVLLFR
ncbi:hypothetical protein ACFOSC_18505 [Streptantibioticus rubrisoli]|uniref:Uncharacterized protein n=1 Tax=Streptantibioticus rubrisoli TaxID=1387313 RepID=A0ABT1PE10_9ACTN|nr:hypothetical protein [Streptantibioticus rubrisoli]MCQ4043597.1 hypothetical protein [Streptantibioticus rubrisoli]